MASNIFKESTETLFGRYGASQGVDISNSGEYGGIDLKIRFYDYSSFVQFLNELNEIQKYIDEKSARLSNPTIQRAYDEYQLLLKLSK